MEHLQEYKSEIERFKELAENLPEDIPTALLKKIELLVKTHHLLGYVAAESARFYKKFHESRKQQYWDAYESAKGNKRMAADRAVYEVEMLEAEAYADKMMYQNEFESIEEEIHALKQKMRVNFADGTIGSQFGGAV